MLHSVVDREEHEKYLFLPLAIHTEDSLMTACAPIIDETQFSALVACLM